MQTSSIPLLFGICFFFTTQPYVFAQNLLANPDFEDENICTEFIARCAPEAWLEVNYGRIFYLQNDKGSKVAIRLSNDPGMRTFLFTELLCPLIAGETYRISFDLNLREAEFRSFGIFLSVENLKGRFNQKTLQPTLTITENNSLKKIKKMDWLPFAATFQASGEERFLYIGYFDAGQKLGKRDWFHLTYIDNIELIPENKEIQICAEAEAKRAEIYAENRRHYGFPDPDAAEDTIRNTNAVFEVPVKVEELAQPEKIADTPQRSDTLVLAGVCFDFNKSTLNERYAAITDSLTDKIIARNPEQVFISGHTDNVGSDEFNLKLSLARAETIKQVLIQKGMDARKIVCEGLGEMWPVADNDTENGRAKNRRIEVVLIFKE